MQNNQKLATIKEASNWASKLLDRNVSTANIFYLLQYGKVKKHNNNGTTLISLDDLNSYYKSYHGERELSWKKKLGNDLNWALSFDHLRELDTTKHVHRLHPYKGKFIPQLVEYFLDNHKDNFKKRTYFKKGDVVLDPFCGSGTTLVQANELGMHAVGIEISTFNTLITNIKVEKHNLARIQGAADEITVQLERFITKSRVALFENELLNQLKIFNTKHFPSPSYKYKLRQGTINEHKYSVEKDKEFLKTYKALLSKYNVKTQNKQRKDFLDKWYINTVRKEIDFVFNLVKKIQDNKIKRIISIILSRTIRSCRATTHSDLATLKEPQLTTYYCRKHGKICKPLFSSLSWWKRYSVDTINRLKLFDNLRTDTHQLCVTGDSQNINIFAELNKRYPKLGRIARQQKIKGIFSSPPYVGLINYHEQHAYAYDLFGFERRDEQEIGPLSSGQGYVARNNYAEGVASVLRNSKKYLADNASVFLVANDKWNLYPQIAEKAGLKIVEQFKRPVLNRTERDKGAYAEIIFHLK